MKKYSLLFVLIIALFACENKPEIAETTTEKTTENTIKLTDVQYQNAKIELVTLTKANIKTTLKLNGKIDVPPQNLVSVSAPMGGYLRNTKLLPGMHINKGEVLAQIDDQQFVQLQQDYLLAKSKLYFAKLDYTRQYELNQSQASSDKLTQQAQALVQEQEILMHSIGEKLRLININPNKLTQNNVSKSINIYANISGYVTKVNANIGKYIAASDVLFELVNPTDIHLNIKVYEKDVSRLKIGQKVQASTNAEPDKKHVCEIILISKNIDADGSTEVHCHFENYDKNLLLGMYMNAELELNSNIAGALPEEAVVDFEGQSFVFIETQKQTYEMVAVQAGKTQNGLVIIENIKDLEGKKIVGAGAYKLLMAMKNTEEE